MDTQGIRAYLISSRELAADWIVLYAVTFALQLLCASVRGALVYVVLWVMLTLGKEPTGYAHLIAFLAAYGPLAFSLLTLILPYGCGWPPSQLGGRYPSEHEQSLYRHALANIKTLDPNIREPRRWYVRDQDAPQAIAYADTLLISSGLLEHEHAPLLLARQLAHLSTSDARLTAALQRITTPPQGPAPLLLKAVCFVATGQLGMWVLKGSWDAYWRTREHHADRYAHNLQQKAASQRARQVADRSEPVKGTPPGPPAAGPYGLPLTEP